MLRLSFLAIPISLLAVGCGSDTTAPTTTTPQNKFVFTATLLPANETPAVVGAEVSGTGNVTITMNTTRDSAGNITAASVDFLATMTGFPAGTTITAAHIHQGAAGCACPVVVSTLIAQGEVTMPNGSGSLVHTNPSVSPVDIANQIIANPSGFYFNIHSPANPGGVARGQLVRAQ
jgi:hypothetical protein